MDQFESYIYGLLSTDGHMSEQSRNRGRITLEINKKDIDILYKIKELLPITCSIRERERVTNFGHNSSAILSIYDMEYRLKMQSHGFIVGRKDMKITPPTNTEYSLYDYWRGVIDADGSLGITALNKAFVSVVLNSEIMKESYIDLLEPIIGYRKKINRNKRDNIYNIMVNNAHAVDLVHKLYYMGCLGIERKISKAQEIVLWGR